ncbi:uncharacterized protein [Gossypium hirsutum]|uniref:Reverse transcriptase domain-containing protein n=1 Tax=Gossypium hirsutum TaxID=3635 RepID=A0A1U8IHA6_GOSHI|nr:uncharacterized protein LOC107894501 [Gossypium hirsutum]
MERLDRAICNNAWFTLFPNSLVTHLPRLKSDHRPLEFSLMPAIHSSQGRPFRFLAGWVEHPAFSDFVKENWKVSSNMSTVHSEFTDQVKRWNKVVPVFDEEIKTASFDMAPLKAPISDGFHVLFYQSQWDHVDTSVFSWVKGIFAGKSIDSELNNSLIIIANRFKVVFPKLIAPEQTGFLAGQNITDDIVIAQEVIHSMRSLQKNRRWMTIKIDLENAYGRVLWNGVPTTKFQPTRGVRQGCPLSPYLFILCKEWLSHSIQAAIGVGNRSPIRLVRNGPPLSHIFFADNLILFGHAEEHQEVSNLGLYLGVPLFYERVTNYTLHFVVDKVRNKLSSWDARQLSLVGRVTLAQSILLSIPSYFMQTMMIPTGLCDEIENIVQKFVWGSTNGNTKIVLVSWDSVCQPKAHGDLGLRHLEDHNTSFMMNMGFNIVSNTNALWVRVIRTKYDIPVDYPRIY